MDLNQILSLSLYAMAVSLVFYGAPTLEAGMSLTLSPYWVAVFSLSTRVLPLLIASCFVLSGCLLWGSLLFSEEDWKGSRKDDGVGGAAGRSEWN